jgi:hypothetical protein
VRGEQQPGQLVAHPLGRDDGDALGHLGHGGDTTPGATVNASWAANRAARIMRNGSSENDSCGVPGVRSTPGREVGQPAERVDEVGSGQPDRHGVDREVAPSQVPLQRVAVGHLGLRDDGS